MEVSQLLELLGRAVAQGREVPVGQAGVVGLELRQVELRRCLFIEPIAVTEEGSADVTVNTTPTTYNPTITTTGSSTRLQLEYVS